MAEAFFKASARRFVVGRGVAETDSRLRVGSYVDLQGLGPLFSGKYYLSEVRHRFDGAQACVRNSPPNVPRWDRYRNRGVTCWKKLHST